MNHESDASAWIVGLLPAALISALVLLSKIVLDKLLFGRLKELGESISEMAKDNKKSNDDVMHRMDSMASDVKEQNQRLALGNQAFASLRDKVAELERENRENRDIERRRDLELTQIHEMIRDLQEDSHRP